MRKSVSALMSVLAVAGLVNEGLSARAADPFSPSLQSALLICMYCVLLFVCNLKPFHKISLNIGRFDFDSHCLGGNMFLIKDRAMPIFKALGLKSVSPPK